MSSPQTPLESSGYPWEYRSIPWDYIDKQWWSLPVELITFLYCFIGFHVASSSHLLPSLDAFCRKWNISHQTAQPTIYALGAVAPIIILSNVAFASDILHQTTMAHKLGIASIIGFGLTTACFVPSCAVFSLIGRIVLPTTTTIRDSIVIVILLSTFFVIIITGRVFWWQSTIIGMIYVIYLMYVILYPKIKEIFQSPNPLARNRLLTQLQEQERSTRHRQIRTNTMLEQSYQTFEPDEPQPTISPFDSTRLFSSNAKQPELFPVVQDHNINAEFNQSTYSMSPDRKSTQSNRSSIASLRHPMLLSEYDPDFPLLDDEFPIDIEENENESLTMTDDNPLTRIVLSTPKGQQSIHHIYPTIQFESLNNDNSNPSPPSNARSNCKQNLRTCFQRFFQLLCSVYYYLAFPVEMLLKFTIPATTMHSKCECLYPISLIFSCLWMTVFAYALIALIYHYAMLFSWSLAIIGVVYIGPIAAFPNIVDCVTLSLQGFASEITINSYHIQISNLFFGVIVPLLLSSVISEINAYQHYIKE
eukprot:65402_1